MGSLTSGFCGGQHGGAATIGCDETRRARYAFDNRISGPGGPPIRFPTLRLDPAGPRQRSDPAGSDRQQRLPMGRRVTGEAGGRHRSHQRPARDRRVLLRLSGEEHAALVEAAGRVGLTAAGFAAEVALSAARGEAAPPAHGEMRGLLVELVAGRTQVRRYGLNVNRAVAQLAATGAAPGWLERAAAGADRGVARLDEAAGQVGSVLRRGRR